MKKLICVAIINLKQWNEYGQYIANGSYVKTFDSTKFANIEEAREAKALEFGIAEKPHIAVSHSNQFLPKAHKAGSGLSSEGYLVCDEKDIKQIMVNIKMYYDDADHSNEDFLFRVLRLPKKAYRKYTEK